MNPAADVCRVMQAIESHEGAHPMDMDILRPYAVVEIGNALAQLIEHFHGFHAQGKEGKGFEFDSATNNAIPAPFAHNARPRVREQASELTGETVS